MSTTSEDEASGMKLHEVLFAPCLSARPLFSCHRSIAHASARASVTGLLLVRHWSVAGLSLVCHWSVVGLLGSWPLVRVADRASLVHPSCIARASLVRHSSACSSFCWSAARPSLAMAVALPVALPLLRLLVCLLARRFLVTRLSAGPSLLVRRCCIVGLPACPSLAVAVLYLFRVTGLSLIHLLVRLLVHRSSIAHPSVRPSARASLIHRSSICSCVCSSQVCLSLVRHSSLSRVSHESLTGLSVRSSLVCLLVQLLGSWSLPRGWSATRLSPIRRWSWPLVHLLVRRALLCPLLCPLLSCLLFCHQSVCSGHGRWLAHPLVVCCSCVIGHGRRSATHAPLVCLLVFPAARLPVALPLVRRCSACWSVCWCVAGLSVGASLVHLFVHHWSICYSAAGLSARSSLVHMFGSCHSCV